VSYHVLAYSIAIDTDVYGVKYRQPDNFVPKLKKGAKPKRGKYSKASRTQQINCITNKT